LFLFPSATETFGNVILEAMASGTAVIGAASGGVKDTITHKQNGFLCAPGNVAEFVNAVELLYHDLRCRLEIANAGYAYSLKQSWESIFSGLYDSYLSVLGESFSKAEKQETAVK
jgi:glycosyltransferase involved in cell wall biosynthesis